MPIEDAKQFTDEVDRYTGARRTARKVRNMVANLNMALAVAAQYDVEYEVQMELRDVNPGRSDCQSARKQYGHVTIKCVQPLEANEPADWVLEKFRLAAERIAAGTEETE